MIFIDAISGQEVDFPLYSRSNKTKFVHNGHEFVGSFAKDGSGMFLCKNCNSKLHLINENYLFYVGIIYPKIKIDYNNCNYCKDMSEGHAAIKDILE